MEDNVEHNPNLHQNVNKESTEEHMMMILERIFELKEKYSNSGFDVWMKVSEETQISTGELKKILFDYALENFSDLCQFCFKLNRNTTMEHIFPDSEEHSSSLLSIINYTLYQANIFDKMDYKLSNLVCEDCKLQIFEYYNFKKQCDLNTEILQQVKIKLQIDSEEKSEKEDTSANEFFQPSEVVCIEEFDILKKNILKKKRKVLNCDLNSRTQKAEHNKKSSQCSICGKIVKGLQMHMLIHSGTKKHSCQYCSKSFTQSGQLKRHINSHLNIRNYECPWKGCNRTFVDPSSVNKHLVVHNKEERKFQCSLCGSRFNRLGALRYHEKVHRQERNHHCNICNKSFLAKYDLTKHYRTHTGEKPYQCQYCDKKFSISKNAKVHQRVHTKEKPYSCKFCDLSFAYRSSMKNHLIKIHNHAGDSSNLPIIITNQEVNQHPAAVDNVLQN